MTNEERILARLDELEGEVSDLRKKRGREPSALVTVIGTFAVLLAGTAIAQPSLSSFSANTPARASEVNANFDLVQDWIEEKVGAVNSTDVDITGTTTTNAITVNGAGTFNAGAEVTSGGLNVTGSSVFQDAVTFNGGASVSGGLTVPTGNVTVSDGDLTVTDGGGTVSTADGRVRVTASSANWDVWIQGSQTVTGAGDDRNLALLGADEDSGDTLYLNWNGEYAGGTQVSSDLHVTGDVTIAGGLLNASGETNQHIGGTTNTAYSSRTSLGSTTNRICFLSGMYREGSNERVGCHVTADSGTWYLEAVRGGSLDMDCWARCVTWN